MDATPTPTVPKLIPHPRAARVRRATRVTANQAAKLSTTAHPVLMSPPQLRLLALARPSFLGAMLATAGIDTTEVAAGAEVEQFVTVTATRVAAMVMLLVVAAQNLKHDMSL